MKTCFALICNIILILFWIQFAEAYTFTKGYKVIITEYVYEQTQDALSDELCRNFKLTEKNIKLFFKKSNRIEVNQLSEYDWFPCYLTGEINDKSGIYKWTIRPNGLGNLITPNGETIWLGCKTCDFMF